MSKPPDSWPRCWVLEHYRINFNQNHQLSPSFPLPSCHQRRWTFVLSLTKRAPWMLYYAIQCEYSYNLFPSLSSSPEGCEESSESLCSLWTLSHNHLYGYFKFWIRSSETDMTFWKTEIRNVKACVGRNGLQPWVIFPSPKDTTKERQQRQHKMPHIAHQAAQNKWHYNHSSWGTLSG